MLLLLSAHAEDPFSFGVGVEVGGDGGVEVEIDLCEGVECDDGDDCHVVVSPLLQLPVAHCVHSNAAPPPRDQGDRTCIHTKLHVVYVLCMRKSTSPLASNPGLPRPDFTSPLHTHTHTHTHRSMQ